jgi:hypothetical protein
MKTKKMDKVETIRKHLSGNPNIDSKLITWVEFLSDIKPESEDEMYGYAILLLSGDFLYGGNGYTYFLNGINLRDNPIKTL